MSLTRLFLRALAVNALSPQPNDTVGVTLADNYVFDSMLDPAQLSQTRKDIPAIIVYTDEDDADLIAHVSGGGPYRRHATLRVEILIGTFTDSKDGRYFGLTSTDAELEARLDIFEQQVKWALLQLTHRPATMAFRKFVINIPNFSSKIFRDEEGSTRISRRVLTFKCQIYDDCPPAYGLKAQCSGPLTSQNFGSFPDYMQEFLPAMQATPSMQAALNVLAGTGDPVLVLPLLKRIGVKVDCIDPYDPNLVPSTATRGPDGRVEIDAVWPI